MNLKKSVAHQPFSCELSGATTAVIFIHGILEGPYQFHGLAEKILDQGMSSFGILLPGHGGTAKDFANSNKKEWVKHVDKQIESVAKRYEKIVLVGHSMGTLLSLLASERYDKVVGVVCLATPLAVKVNLQGFLCTLKVLTGRYHPNDAYVMASYRTWSVSRGSWRDYVKWIRRYLDLFDLMYETRKRLPYLSKPILFIHCRRDEFVRNKTTKIIRESMPGDNYEVVELKKSGHFYYRGDESQKLDSMIVQFLLRFQSEEAQS